MSHQSQSPDLSIIIVNHNTSALLEACLRSVLAETSDLSAEIIVVDNASSDGSPDMVRENFPAVQVITNRSNIGFARANNQALTVARGRFLVLLNSDTVIQDRALLKLKQFMDGHREVGMCAPLLHYPDGSPQQSTYPFPSLRGALALYTGLHGRFPSVAHRLAPGWCCTPLEVTSAIDWCSAACVMVSRTCFEAIGPLDDSFFMYAEDTDWCRQATERGWKVMLFADAHVIHYLGGSQGTSTGQYERRMRELAGTIHYLRKWHGRAYAALYRAFVRVCGLYRYFRRRRTADSPQELSYYLRLTFGHEN